MDIETFAQIQADGFDEGGGLKFLPGGNDLRQGHAGFHGEGGLGDDGALIEVHINKVRGDAGNFDAVFVGLAIGLGTGKAWQQGRVDVDDFVFVMPHELRGKDLHEPREHDKINTVFVEDLDGFFFARIAVFPGEIMEREPGFFGEGFEHAVVGDDDGGFGGEGAVFEGLDQALEAVGFLGDEDASALAVLGGGEPGAHLHAQVLTQGVQTGINSGAVERLGLP